MTANRNNMASSIGLLFGAFRAIHFQFTTPLLAVAQACALALMYVGSLYINASHFPSQMFGKFVQFVLQEFHTGLLNGRSHPVTVKKRFQAVLIVCLISPIMVFLWSRNADEVFKAQSFPLYIWLGLHSDNILAASALPLVLTIILFLGPLLQYFLSSYKDEDSEDSSLSTYLVECLTNIVFWRNFVLAPLTEEFVFRACMLPFLFPAFGHHASVFLCPLFFGIAHVHHAIEGLKTGYALRVVIIRTAFQMAYTTLFGAYSAFLFLRTGHLIGPVLCHSFCNMMGFPDFDAISYSRFPKVVSAAYVIGLGLFIRLLFPLTNPDYFSSIYWNITHI